MRERQGSSSRPAKMLIRSFPRWLVLVLLLGRSPLAADSAVDFFEKRVRPVLAEHCYECHSETSTKLKGGLKLDSRAGVERGGDSGPILIKGDPERSRLLEAVRYHQRELQMPPKGRLPEADIAALEQWISSGAVDPRDAPVSATSSATPLAQTNHWAFQPLQSATPPTVAASARVQTPVDRFVQARQAELGLTLALPASPTALVRRLYLDLTGLPPTPDEASAFLADPSPLATERLIERLLASPRYGERWGRWWLDLARYADSNGQDENKVMANAWRYRDWVIRSFNAGQPFDQFVTDQLAGDLLPTNGVPESVLFDRWTATGFLVLGPKMLAEQDKPKLVMDLVDEQIDVLTRAFLGLTVGCARCHDHKFDPIPARDYYALAGIFKSTRAMANLDFVSKFNERQVTPREQLEALAAHQEALQAHQKVFQATTNKANAALQGQLKSAFPATLVAALQAAEGTNTPAPPTGVEASAWTNLVQTLRATPADHAASRTFREWARQPETIPAQLTALESLSREGLRVGPGRVGGGFLGTGQSFLELPHAPELEPPQLTLETWVRATEFSSTGDNRRWLISKNGNEWVEGHYGLVLDQNRPGAYLNIGGGKENLFALWSDGPRLRPNQWYHLALTYDGITLRLWVDGAAAGAVAVNRARIPGNQPLALGRRQDGYVSFRGNLDEAYLWNRALTPEELQRRAADPRQLPQDRPVVSWTFNDLTDAEQQALAQFEVRDALWGSDGILALPANPRPLYPEDTRNALNVLEQERRVLTQSAPPPPAFALAVADDKPVDLPVYVRGSHLSPGKDPVPRGFIQVAYRGEPAALPARQSGRLELAHWLTSPSNPLPARVIVNRVWQAHFGEGLVRTPDNFGLRGEAPTHPELLDWLAREFLESGWDLKHLHRLILNSATWQQSSRTRTDDGSPVPSLATDPDNRWLARFPRQRLEAEMVRDALLAVSGRLDLTTGGTLVDWKNDEYVPTDTVSAESARRSVYLPIVRDRVYDVFTLFDFANPSVGTAKRTPTVVSHQALFFLNSPLVKSSASALATRLLAETGDDEQRLRSAYQRCYNRDPLPAEKARGLQFLEQNQGAGGPEGRLQAWSAYAQILMAANEFLYRD